MITKKLDQRELRVLVPTGMLGYGFPMEWFKEGLRHNPHVIAVDSGSTDSGPHKLALGAMTCSREAYYYELEMLIDAGKEKNIPVIISSVGGDGSNMHVDEFVKMTVEIAKKKGYKLNIAAIYADIDKNMIKKQMFNNKITPCGPIEPLIEQEVDEATVIVGQMGVEPYLKIFNEKPDVDIIIAGRTYDPVPMASLGLYYGFDPGVSYHMGKIIECGALCAGNARDVILAYLKDDNFMLEPMNPNLRCTVNSVAAHTMYEKSHPYLLPGPGGLLDLSQCLFEQENDRMVKVRGSKFIPANPYTIKLEGAKVVGYRSICIAGIRDPILIDQIDYFLNQVKQDVYNAFPQLMEEGQVIFHVYGKNGVMGSWEPDLETTPKELCVIVEAISNDQNEANILCNKARTCILHNPYEKRLATSGNAAFPFTPLEIPLGEVCKFNIYHLIEVDNPCEIFPVKYFEIGDKVYG